MSESIIDRAARALAQVHGEERVFDDLETEAISIAGREAYSSAYLAKRYAEMRREYRDEVRAVLTAIRDPAREARLAAWGHPGSDGEGHSKDMAIWQAMIDAALAEER